MGCNCGKKKGSSVSARYRVTFPDGTKRSFSSEEMAKQAVKRRGGSYKPA